MIIVQIVMVLTITAVLFAIIHWLSADGKCWLGIPMSGLIGMFWAALVVSILNPSISIGLAQFAMTIGFFIGSGYSFYYESLFKVLISLKDLVMASENYRSVAGELVHDLKDNSRLEVESAQKKLLKRNNP